MSVLARLLMVMDVRLSYVGSDMVMPGSRHLKKLGMGPLIRGAVADVCLPRITVALKKKKDGGPVSHKGKWPSADQLMY